MTATAVELCPLDYFEEARSADAHRILPASLRLADLHTRIPRVYAAMRELFAAGEDSP